MAFGIRSILSTIANLTTLVSGTATALSTSGSGHGPATGLWLRGYHTSAEIAIGVNITSAPSGDTTVSVVIGAATCSFVVPGGLAVGRYLFRLRAYANSTSAYTADLYWMGLPPNATSITTAQLTYTPSAGMSPTVNITMNGGAGTARILETLNT